jgi:hypothetical protein
MATETRTDVRAANTQQAMPDQMRMQQRGAQPSGGGPPMNRPAMYGVQVGGETKHALKTTEFWIYLASVGFVLLASYLVGHTAAHTDYFRADRAWFFITLLTIGYLFSRGLAKAGSSTRGRAMPDRQAMEEHR